MIPTIGIMIGCYIITKMLSLLSKKDEESRGTLVFAGITIAVAVLGIVSLLGGSGTGL